MGGGGVILVVVSRVGTEGCGRCSSAGNMWKGRVDGSQGPPYVYGMGRQQHVDFKAVGVTEDVYPLPLAVG